MPLRPTHSRVRPPGPRSVGVRARPALRASTAPLWEPLTSKRFALPVRASFFGTETSCHARPQLKTKLGFDSSKSFEVSKEVYDFWGGIKAKGAALQKSWNQVFESYLKTYPKEASTRRLGLIVELSVAC